MKDGLLSDERLPPPSNLVSATFLSIAVIPSFFPLPPPQIQSITSCPESRFLLLRPLPLSLHSISRPAHGLSSATGVHSPHSAGSQKNSYSIEMAEHCSDWRKSPERRSEIVFFGEFISAGNPLPPFSSSAIPMKSITTTVSFPFFQRPPL